MPENSLESQSMKESSSRRTGSLVLLLRPGASVHAFLYELRRSLSHPHRKYENGAVGTFTHCVALKGRDFSCELEVFADGYQMK